MNQDKLHQELSHMSNPLEDLLDLIIVSGEFNRYSIKSDENKTKEIKLFTLREEKELDQEIDDDFLSCVTITLNRDGDVVLKYEDFELNISFTKKPIPYNQETIVQEIQKMQW